MLDMLLDSLFWNTHEQMSMQLSEVTRLSAVQNQIYCTNLHKIVIDCMKIFAFEIPLYHPDMMFDEPSQCSVIIPEWQ